MYTSFVIGSLSSDHPLARTVPFVGIGAPQCYIGVSSRISRYELSYAQLATAALARISRHRYYCASAMDPKTDSTEDIDTAADPLQTIHRDFVQYGRRISAMRYTDPIVNDIQYVRSQNYVRVAQFDEFLDSMRRSPRR